MYPKFKYFNFKEQAGAWVKPIYYSVTDTVGQYQPLILKLHQYRCLLCCVII